MKPLVTDELWDVAAPLLPRRRAEPRGGRPSVEDRATRNGVLYVLRTGIAWRRLPTELGWGSGRPDALRCRASGPTCWRRLREWQRRGVWKRLHRAMLDRLAAADQIDRTRAAKGDPPSGGTGPTRASRARSTTSSRTATGSRSRSR